MSPSPRTCRASRPKGGEVTRLRSEALVWQGAAGGDAYKRDPVPLAMLPEGNLQRDLALMALHLAGRQWRIACVSESIAGLQATALSDSAIIVVAESASAAGLAPLGRDSGLPGPPAVDLMRWRRRPGLSIAAEQLAAQIERHTRSSEAAVTRPLQTELASALIACVISGVPT